MQCRLLHSHGRASSEARPASSPSASLTEGGALARDLPSAEPPARLQVWSSPPSVSWEAEAQRGSDLGMLRPRELGVWLFLPVCPCPPPSPRPKPSTLPHLFFPWLLSICFKFVQYQKDLRNLVCLRAFPHRGPFRPEEPQASQPCSRSCFSAPSALPSILLHAANPAAVVTCSFCTSGSLCP